MQTRKRVLYFVLLNIFVSALTTFIVVSVLNRNLTPTTPSDLTADSAQDGDLEPADDHTAPDQPADSGDPVDVAIGQLEIDTVIGAGDLLSERVLVRHIGDEEVSLVGWQLQDEDGHVFSFPALTMFSGGAVTVYSQSGTNTVVEMYWGQTEAVWSVGEKAYLVDPNGDVQAVFEVP
ncbi:MAG: lamin tail domain-containing protein [Chloroflexota bacterium]